MFDRPDFASASAFLGIIDERLCIQSLRHIQVHGLGANGQRVLGLPQDATIEQIVTRVEEYAPAALSAPGHCGR